MVYTEDFIYIWKSQQHLYLSRQHVACVHPCFGPISCCSYFDSLDGPGPGQSPAIPETINDSVISHQSSSIFSPVGLHLLPSLSPPHGAAPLTLFPDSNLRIHTHENLRL